MNSISNNIYYNSATHTTHYKTDYVQECLVERDNQEIMQKYLRGEQLTEEESKTVSDCATEKKESGDKGIIITLVIVGVLLVAAIICAFLNV